MYKTKEDCKTHYALLEKCHYQHAEFFDQNAKVVTLASLPDVMTDLFIMYEDHHKKLSDLVEDKTIDVETLFFDLGKIQISLQKDIIDLRKAAVKNDTTLTPDQKVALIAGGISFDTLQGSMHKEMSAEAMIKLIKKSGLK